MNDTGTTRPISVEFYNDWHLISTRASPKLCALIKAKPSIRRDFEGSLDRSMRGSGSVSGDDKNRRHAYSLLGIFDVKMPLFYRKVEKAFTRLQEAIRQGSSDQFILSVVVIDIRFQMRSHPLDGMMKSCHMSSSGL